MKEEFWTYLGVGLVIVLGLLAVMVNWPKDAAAFMPQGPSSQQMTRDLDMCGPFRVPSPGAPVLCVNMPRWTPGPGNVLTFQHGEGEYPGAVHVNGELDGSACKLRVPNIPGGMPQPLLRALSIDGECAVLEEPEGTDLVKRGAEYWLVWEE
jgi:hypothetical protein